MTHLLVHLAVCLGIVAACVCRLNHDICRHDRRARLRVVTVLGSALVSAAQPLLFGTVATVSESLLGLVVLAGLLLNAGREWRAYVGQNPGRSTCP